jgi:predicted MFS family arabinose efflux permease
MSRPDLTHRFDQASSVQRSLPTALILVALLVAAVGSLGAPLITRVATSYHVSLAAAQWTLTVTLLSGAVTTPLIGRLGAGHRRRTATLATLSVVTAGSVCTVLPGPFSLLIVGRAAQGVGLGLGPLLMATARDVFDQRRAAGVIAMLSVATTAAIGVGRRTPRAWSPRPRRCSSAREHCRTRGWSRGTLPVGTGSARRCSAVPSSPC